MNVLGLTPFGFELPLPVVALGLIVGITYGLLAAGLVLVYRTSRIINFAHGQVGAFGAVVLSTAVLRWHFPYYLAIPVALASAAAVGALSEVVVIRRLRKAPRLMSIVATLGVGQFLLLLAAAFNPQSDASLLFPSPPFMPELQFGALRITQASVAILVFGPVLVVALSLFLIRSRFGLALRCSSANPEAARMAGISASRMSALAWALAGMLSAFTAILVFPSGRFTGASFGPSLLLRALAGAVVARMYSLPVALAAGVGLGIVEQLLLWNYSGGGIADAALYVIILAGVLARRDAAGRGEEKGSWTAVQGWRPLPEAVARLREVRWAPWVLAAVGVAIALVLPSFVTNSAAITLSAIMAFAIVGISVALITGLGGQLSLGQFAVGAVGAVVSYHVVTRTESFPLALLYAGLAAAGISVLIGLPALRVRGLMLTVTTLGFALVASSWLLQQPWMLGEGVNPTRPSILGNVLDGGREYYYFVLALLGLMLLLAHNVRRSGLGRILVAVRDNEDNARAFTVRARLVKLQGFALAGFVAGIGGAAYGHLLSRIGDRSFPVDASINVVAMSVIGGLGMLVGPLVGALYIIGLPAFVPLDSAGLAATQLGWLVLILYLPGGVAQAIEPLRMQYVRWVARRRGIDLVEAETAPADVALEQSRLSTVATPVERLQPPGSVLLEAVGISKRFGGVTAVDDLTMRVRAGEVVGLIGPNGAGKTTTFEVLGGFTQQDRGLVRFDGDDISAWGPEARAHRGLIRSFQDAALFPTMTVDEVVRLAFERMRPTSFFGSVVGLRGAERAKESMAKELIGAMGLHQYRHKQVRELSTGTRRITEIACLVALRPTLLLLDEPSSGIAQRETEALGRLLLELKEELDLTLIVIEHDIPLIMGLSDRIFVMDSGRLIAEGPPSVVRDDPAVVEAYLGTSASAIERSGGMAVAVSKVGDAAGNGHRPLGESRPIGPGRGASTAP